MSRNLRKSKRNAVIRRVCHHHHPRHSRPEIRHREARRIPAKFSRHLNVRSGIRRETDAGMMTDDEMIVNDRISEPMIILEIVGGIVAEIDTGPYFFIGFLRSLSTISMEILLIQFFI